MAAPGEAQLIEACAEAWPLAKPFIIARAGRPLVTVTAIFIPYLYSELRRPAK